MSDLIDAVSAALDAGCSEFYIIGVLERALEDGSSADSAARTIRNYMTWTDR